MNRVRRGPALAVIVAVLVAGALLDRRSRPALAGSRAAATQVPAAAPASAHSSTWYCTGATAAPNAPADGTVLVANAGTRPLTGTVTAVPSQGSPRQVPIQVPPASRATVHLADVAPAPFASAVVDLDGGQAAVELSGAGPLGESVTPCASGASPHWYFAEGATTKDATETLLLFNPFPDDAVVDLAFSTEEGQVVPQALTGISVAGQGMTALNVGDFVQRRESVTASISARTGRLVVARLQTFDGSAGRKGMSVTLGSAAAATTWFFPDGQVSDGLVERFQVFNPGTREARTELDLALEQGQAEPILVTVPPESRVSVKANDEGRIPKNVPHATTVRSVNGVPIVVERSVDTLPASHRTGFAAMLGAQVTARSWSFVAGQATDTVDEWVVVQNPGSRPLTVTFTVLAGGTRTTPDTLRGLEVAPGTRRAVHLADSGKRDAAPLVVEGTGPFVVERDLLRLKGPGTAMTIGIPLAGLSQPPAASG